MNLNTVTTLASQSSQKHRKSSRQTMTLPVTPKANLFVVKNADRELWLHSDTKGDRKKWTDAIDRCLQSILNRETQKVARHPQWQLEFRNLKGLEKVADGAFGVVYKGKLWGTAIAAKVLKTPSDGNERSGAVPQIGIDHSYEDSSYEGGSLRTQDEEWITDLKKEIEILSQLRHPNIVLYIGACTKLPNVCIVMEWCSRGSLFDILHDMSIHIDTGTILSIANGIAQGMNYLHSLASRIVHRDLKSHNVLIDDKFTVKLADFGLSHVRQKQNRYARSDRKTSEDSGEMGGVFGTPEWMAPEIMEGLPYNQKVDVYSFGIVMCELVSRETPFTGVLSTADPIEIIEAVLEDGVIPRVPDWCKGFFSTLIMQCLNRNPSRRPDFNQIIPLLIECKRQGWPKQMSRYDIPRLREFLWNPSRKIQIIAASELEQLCRLYPRSK